MYLHSSQVRVLFEKKWFSSTFIISRAQRLFICTQCPNNLWRLQKIIFSCQYLHLPDRAMSQYCLLPLHQKDCSCCKNSFINLCPDSICLKCVITHFPPYLAGLDVFCDLCSLKRRQSVSLAMLNFTPLSYWKTSTLQGTYKYIFALSLYWAHGFLIVFQSQPIGFEWLQEAQK